MIARLFIFSVLLFSVSCEIDDDYGKSKFTENKGTFLLREDYGVSKVIWYNASNVLIHQSGSSLRILNVNSKNSTVISSNQLYYNLFGVTTEEKAVVSTYNDNVGTYSLVTIDLSSETPAVLTDNLLLSGYNTLLPLVRGDLVVYSEPSQNVNSVYIHNVATNERSLIFEQATPVAISPDGKKIAGWDSNNQGFIYDIESKAYTPINIPFDPAMRIYWSDEGILGYQILYGNTLTVNVLNFSDPQETFMVEGAQSESLIIGNDGRKFVFPTAKCANPYYVYYCYGESAYVTLKGVDVASRKESDVVVFSPNPNEYSGAYLQSGDFSPDGTKLVYVLNNEIYSQDFPN